MTVIFKLVVGFFMISNRLDINTRYWIFKTFFILPLCLVLLAPPQARHKGWTGQARWLKLNANTSELGGEGQPQPNAEDIA